MKYMPSTRSEWFGFLALPLKALVVAGVFIFPIWFRAVRPFKGGTFTGQDFLTIDADKLPFGIEVLATIYFGVFLALLSLAILQAASKQRRIALWSGIFAIGALCLAILGAIHPVYR
jgi:hypothetical protein